jgi:SH3-like domain-containing protein
MCPTRAVCGFLILVGLLAPSMADAAETSPPAAPGAPPTAGEARYVSLKSDRVNLRKGPGTEYPTVWVFRRAGLPVEVVRTYEGWREVRDAEGASGWVLAALLSRRRTALIEPWAAKADAGAPPPPATLYAEARDTAAPVAAVEAGVIADIVSCDGAWCRVVVDRYRGYIRQQRLWGVYEAEKIQ